MFRHSKQTNLPATSAVYSVPTDLFVMKSRREREREREPVSICIAPPAVRRRLRHFWMHSGERLVNNTKRPRQTNIASGFTGDTRGASRALLPYEKLLYRVNAQPYHFRRLVGRDAARCCEMLRDDRQQGRETDKDQTPAVYTPLIGSMWSGNFVVGAYRDVLSHLPFRFVGLALSSRGV